MGDSGSLVLGFALASFALASSWTVAGTTVATVLLPLLILAIPILDTTFVTLVRLGQRRPVSQGGRDHTSHRLVYYGLSEANAVLLLALVAAAIGATALAYNVLDNARLTAFGVLLTFVLLVQFGSFLSDLEALSPRRGHRGGFAVEGARVRAPPSRRGGRRLRRHLCDVPRRVPPRDRRARQRVRALGLPRGAADSPCDEIRGVRRARRLPEGLAFRYRPRRDPDRARMRSVGRVAFFVLVALRDIGSFPAFEVFVVDAVLCTLLVGASRLTLRLLPEARARGRHRRRVLVVGAGRAGRGLARELRDAQEARVVGFLDDNPRVRRRRILGITVVGALDEAPGRLPARGRTRCSSRSRTRRRSDSMRSCARRRLGSRAASSGASPSSPPPSSRSSLAAVSSVPVAGGRDRPDFLARLQSAVPLLTVYFGCPLYAWQASRHPVPTIYSDEIELAWLSRSIGDRRGGTPRRPVRPRDTRRLLPRPVWWVGSAASGYAAASSCSCSR